MDITSHFKLSLSQYVIAVLRLWEKLFEYILTRSPVLCLVMFGWPNGQAVDFVEILKLH